MAHRKWSVETERGTEATDALRRFIADPGSARVASPPNVLQVDLFIELIGTSPKV